MSCWLISVRGGRGVVCAAIGLLWVRACSSPFFCLSRVSDVFSGELGGALGFGLFCFCVRSVVDYGCEVACEW